MNPHRTWVGSRSDDRASNSRLRLLVIAMAAVTFGFDNAADAQVSGAAVNVSEAVGPKIELAMPVFDFGQVRQGEVVRHEFVFKNTGTAALEITEVSPGCGCTTAGDWDKRVEPGRTGVIPLQVNSTGFSGAVNKSVTVKCNDPLQPTINLQIKGGVWTPFAITPAMALFMVSSEAETSETKVVRIVSQLERPVTLSGVDGTGASFQAELTTLKPGKEFELRITAVPPFASSISVPLSVKTSAPEASAIPVHAQIVVQPPIVAMPDRITLPAGPLPASAIRTITIRNSGKNPLALSDAKANVPGAVVNVQEVEATRQFQVTVKFPAGFDLKPEETVEVSLKSNHPKFAVIRVPVVAAPRPVPAKATAVNAPTSTSSVTVAMPR